MTMYYCALCEHLIPQDRVVYYWTYSYIAYPPLGKYGDHATGFDPDYYCLDCCEKVAEIYKELGFYPEQYLPHSVER